MAARLDLRQNSHLRGLQEKLVSSVERLIQERLDDVHRGMSATPQLAKNINLSKVTDLPTRIAELKGDLWVVEAEVSQTMRDYRLLQTLHFDNIWTRHERIVEAHAETFTWILKGVFPDSDKPIGYVDWLRERDGIFWIHGKPGSGKSTLMKFLVHHPDTASHLQTWARGRKLVIAKFFFWNSGTKLQKSQEGLLRSLLFEILRQFPALLSIVYATIIGSQLESTSREIDIYEVDASLYSWEIQWNLQNLLQAFECLRGQDITANFCFFIDGLDEYRDEEHRDPRDLIKVLRTLVSSPHVKLCLSSRSWTVFKDAFGENPEMTLKLEDLTRKDIGRYVSDRFNEHEQFAKLSLMDPGYADLVDEVARKAQGVFLWVFLVVRDLLEGLTYNDTIKTMRLRLNHFPEDLDDFFGHIFDSIPKVLRVQSARTFQIAMSREEPLPLLTYAFVDDAEEDPNLDFSTSLTLGTKEIQAKQEAMRRRLDGRCRGLLEVVEYKQKHETITQVDFLHRTVRDFLLHTPGIQDEMMENLENKTQTWVLLCRATSLMIKYWPKEDLSIYLRQLFYFVQLAVTDSGNEGIVDQVLLRVFPRIGLLDRNAGRTSDEIPKSIGIFDLCLASQYGLTSYVKQRLPERLRPLDEVASSDLDEEKRLSLLGGVLRHALLGDDSYSKLSPELVDYLLSIGSSPNSPYTHDGIPTTAFALFLRRLDREEISPKQSGVLEIMKSLVDHSADVDVKMDSILSEERLGLPAHARARHVISKHFTSDQATWLLSHAATVEQAEQESDEVSKAQDEQERSREQHQSGKRGPGSQLTSQGVRFYQLPQNLQQQIAPGIQVPRDELYAIKVDNINRMAVLDENGDIRYRAAEAFGQENGVRVVNMAWLSKRDVQRAYGSMVVYVAEWSEAQRLLSQGFCLVGGALGYTSLFERGRRRQQCYNCQQIGHKASHCRNVQVCARCAGLAHHHSGCRQMFVRCALCGGPHESFSWSCPRLRNT